MIYLIVIAIVLAGFLYLILPSLRKHENLKEIKNKFIAHRGFHNKEKGIPENSMAAFAEALAYGFAIETDIHITADGEVVAFHDNSLKRMCSADVNIEDLTLAEIKEFRLDNTDEQIPTLKQLLSLVEGRVPLVIEFKCDKKSCNSLCTAANKILSEYEGAFVIKSFFPPAVMWFKKHNKSVCRGILASVYENKTTFLQYISPFLLNFKTRPDFVSYNEKYRNRFMFSLQKLFGVGTMGWTFRNKETLKKGKKDFDAYIFEEFNPLSKEN